MRVLGMSGLILLGFLCCALSSASCGLSLGYPLGGGRGRNDTLPQDNWQQAFPSPANLPKAASSHAMGMQINGWEWDGALGSCWVNTLGDSAEFLPNLLSAEESGWGDLAFCYYAFHTGGYTGPAILNWSWSMMPGRAFLGLPNRTTETWEWINLDPMGHIFDTLTPYLSPSNEMIFLVVIADTSHCVLDHLTFIASS